MSDSDVEEVEYEIEEFQLREYKLSITTIAYLPITTLMANRTQEKEISGQKLWCGSLCVVNYLFLHENYLSSTAVIVELGAGTGVVSIIASKNLSKQFVEAEQMPYIVATDHDILSLNHMKEDFARNSVDISVESLNWYYPDVESIRATLSSNISSYQSSGKTNFHILAGDVLYKSVLLEPFFSTVVILLNLAKEFNLFGELLLCHIPRADNKHQDVVNKATEKGLYCQKLEREEWYDHDFLDQYSPEEDYSRAEVYIIRLD
jgi:hypothetical protein